MGYSRIRIGNGHGGAVYILEKKGDFAGGGVEMNARFSNEWTSDEWLFAFKYHYDIEVKIRCNLKFHLDLVEEGSLRKCKRRTLVKSETKNDAKLE